MELSTFNTRGFKVVGKLECEFTPEQAITISTKSGFTIELWHKSPMEIIFLGRGVTNDEGDFSVSFNVDGKPPYFNNGEIIDVFMKVYYRGVLISGRNPYATGRLNSGTRPIRDLVIREGVTELGTLQIDVTMFEFPVEGDFKENNPNTPQTNWDFLLGVKYSTGEALPAGCAFNYQVGLNAVSEIAFANSVISSRDEFVKLPVPALPVLPKPEEGEFIIRLKLFGVPDDLIA